MKKPFGLFGIAVLVMAVASGCATPPTQQGLVAGTNLVIGESGELTNLNPAVTASPEAESAELDLAALTRPQFFLHDATGKLAANPEFGTVTRASDGTVTYKLSGKAKWSDGVPVDAADLVVSWLAATDSQVPGYSSYLKRTSLSLADKLTLLPDGVRLHFSRPVPDWQTALPVTVPAHLLGKLAFPNANLSDGAAEKAITDEITSGGTGANSGIIAGAFATGFAVTTNGTAGTSADKRLLVSAGAYAIESATASKLVLVANKDFNAGAKATVAKVIIDCFASPDELLAAIQKNQVDLAAPEASTSVELAKVESESKSAGYTVVAGNSGRFELAMLNYGPGSAFNPDTWGNNPAQVTAARDGIFKFFPRSGIWSVLAGTSGLSKSNSLVFSPTDSSYADSVSKNGTDKYAFQDAEASVEEWQAAKFKSTIKVRVLFDSNSPRGQLEFTQISRLGKLGGFNVENVSTDNPDAVLTSGQWDIYITELGNLASDNSALATAVGAGTNFQNDAVDALVAKVAAGIDLTSNHADAKNLDQLLVKNYYGLPLFQLDGLVVSSSKLRNYVGRPSNESLAWGYSNWSVSTSGK